VAALVAVITHGDITTIARATGRRSISLARTEAVMNGASWLPQHPVDAAPKPPSEGVVHGPGCRVVHRWAEVGDAIEVDEHVIGEEPDQTESRSWVIHQRRIRKVPRHLGVVMDLLQAQHTFFHDCVLVFCSEHHAATICFVVVVVVVVDAFHD
jgi:hypothetical protein